MATTVVTGANKGIGLELANQLKARGKNVIAVCRSTSPDLSALGVRIIEGIDVCDPAAVERLRAELEGQEVDVLVNNAGIMKADKFGHLNYDSMIEQFRVNTLGPLRIIEALAENLHENPKVIIITSRVGSIEDNQSGGYYGYRASKTAVNQMGMNLAHEFRQRGIAVALLHPGMVATELTGGRGISVVESAKGLIARIEELTIQDSGCFRHAEGYKLPW